MSVNHELVKKSNAFIRGSWPVRNIWAHRLVAITAACISVNDKDFQEYEFKLADLAKKSGRSLDGRIINEIWNGVLLTLKTPIEFRNGTLRFACTVFSTLTLDSEKQTIKVKFAPEMKEHFLLLKGNFTTYQLEEYLSIGSTYTAKLYELLNSWRKIAGGVYIVPVEELYRILCVPESMKKNFARFRVILDRAYKDINEDLGLRFSWEPILGGPTGKKVVQLKFAFNEMVTIDTTVNNDPFFEETGMTEKEFYKCQKTSNDCYERHLKLGTPCKPNNGKRCHFCKTRGRMYAHMMCKS